MKRRSFLGLIALLPFTPKAVAEEIQATKIFPGSITSDSGVIGHLRWEGFQVTTDPCGYVSGFAIRNDMIHDGIIVETDKFIVSNGPVEKLLEMSMNDEAVLRAWDDPVC